MASEEKTACVCQDSRFKDWPRVRGHVYAVNDSIPWPPHLQILADFPGRTSLPPSRHSLKKCLAESITSTLTRMRLPEGDTSACVDSILEIWPSMENRDSVVTSDMVRSARNFLGGLVVAGLQGRLNHFCASCPALERELAWELFQLPSGGRHYQYKRLSAAEQQVLLRQAAVVCDDDVPKSLQPRPPAPGHEWQFPRASSNPKLKSGEKKRPPTARNEFPTSELDRTIGRYLDFAVGVWVEACGLPDVRTPAGVQRRLQEYQETSLHLPGSFCVVSEWGAANCFNTVPHAGTLQAWSALKAWLKREGYDFASVPLGNLLTWSGTRNNPHGSVFPVLAVRGTVGATGDPALEQVAIS